jgi:hypothetical protein
MLDRRDLLAGGLALDQVAQRILVAVVELPGIEVAGQETRERRR